MAILARLLVLGGLVVMTGPLCFQAAAQGYVDVEAERAARDAAGGSSPAPSSSAPSSTAPTSDPYGVAPAPQYPTTSYGVGGSPAAPAAAPAAPAPTAAAPTAAAPVAAPSGDAGGVGNLFMQVQQLQQEVMRLNGRVEELSHELRQLNEQTLQRYMDLDQRLGSGGGASRSPGNGPGVAPTAGGNAPPVADAVPPPRTGAAGAEQPGEKAAYDAAYALVVGQRFNEATGAFREFLQRYPDGRYAANAHYWLGELYLVGDPPDLESSRQSFALLLSQYPDHPKAPDALYKLGKVQFLKGNREKGKEYMDLVISQYSPSNHAVVQLARDFLAQNY